MTTGAQLRAAGIQLVLQNQHENWKEHVRRVAFEYIFFQKAGHQFTGEDIRLHCLEQGTGEPLHPNAWGAMIHGAIKPWMKENRIRLVGFRPAKQRAAHCRAVRLYEVVYA